MKFCFLSEYTITLDVDWGEVYKLQWLLAEEVWVAVLLDLFRTIYQIHSSFLSVQFQSTHNTTVEILHLMAR